MRSDRIEFQLLHKFRDTTYLGRYLEWDKQEHSMRMKKQEVTRLAIAAKYRAGIAVTYSPQRARRFLDRIDGIMSREAAAGCRISNALNESLVAVADQGIVISEEEFFTVGLS